MTFLLPPAYRPVRRGLTLGLGDDPKTVVIAGVLVLVVIVAVISIIRNLGGRGRAKYQDRPIHLICSNPECGQLVEYTFKDLRELAKQDGPEGPVGMPGQVVYQCPHCQQETLKLAVQCANSECGKFFLPKLGGAGMMIDDQCPYCGVSLMEAARKRHGRSGGRPESSK